MSELRVNTILAEDGTQTTAPSIPGLESRFAAAWMIYNGVNNTIDQQVNVSSVTDNGVGSYTANLANPTSFQPVAVCNPFGTSANVLTVASSTTSSVSITVRIADTGAATDRIISMIALAN
ncbi:hypothetical protein NVP1232O_19 [Vibrio phage 1.232.O._10N.261.51.E11]|nr:hypothetical protein NVP1232O_19 [Vibrio phage 1.232.O._10N.261.51.E11]